MAAAAASNGGDLGHGPEPEADARRGVEAGGAGERRRACACLIRFGPVLGRGVVFTIFFWLGRLVLPKNSPVCRRLSGTPASRGRLFRAGLIPLISIRKKNSRLFQQTVRCAFEAYKMY
jgi:hypothetical protein